MGGSHNIFILMSPLATSLLLLCMFACAQGLPQLYDSADITFELECSSVTCSPTEIALFISTIQDTGDCHSVFLKEVTYDNQVRLLFCGEDVVSNVVEALNQSNDGTINGYLISAIEWDVPCENYILFCYPLNL